MFFYSIRLKSGFISKNTISAADAVPLGAAAQPMPPLIIYPSILYRKTDLMIT